MKACEDCGDEVQRRTRCPNCKKLVCRWCYHHAHRLEGVDLAEHKLQVGAGETPALDKFSGFSRARAVASESIP